MRIQLGAVFLLLAGCGGDAGGAQDPDDFNDQAASKRSTDVRLTGNPRDLFGLVTDPNRLDGRRHGGEFDRVELYACPNMPDVPSFVRSLWPIWRKATDNLPRPTPSNWTWDDSAAPMRAHIKLTGCVPHHAIVQSSEVLAWDGLVGGDYINDDRWIAFREAGQHTGFFLVHASSVD